MYELRAWQGIAKQGKRAVLLCKRLVLYQADIVRFIFGEGNNEKRLYALLYSPNKKGLRFKLATH